MQGARHGVALDAVPSQFCGGELEATIVEAEDPEVIIVEGQGALSHPAYSTSSFILRGSCPDAVILQHAPGRSSRCDFEDLPMPTSASEIALIQAFSDIKVIGLTVNHENLSTAATNAFLTRYEQEFGMPATDPLLEPDRLLEMVLSNFPQLEERLTASIQ